MSSLNNFKSIADEVMKDIDVGEELKNKTLKQCMKRRHINMGRLLIPAACFVLILAFVNKSGVVPFKTQTGNKEKTEINILMNPAGETKPQEEAGKNPGEVRSWQLNSIEEARKSFGEHFLTPTFIPDGYKLNRIYASGSREDVVSKSVLTYTSGDRSFLIIEEKSSFEDGFTNFRSVEINGAHGYIKPGTLDGRENIESLDSEVHWFLNGIHYSVSGQITENDAVNVAKSMK